MCGARRYMYRQLLYLPCSDNNRNKHPRLFTPTLLPCELLPRHCAGCLSLSVATAVHVPLSKDDRHSATPSKTTHNVSAPQSVVDLPGHTTQPHRS